MLDFLSSTKLPPRSEWWFLAMGAHQNDIPANTFVWGSWVLFLPKLLVAPYGPSQSTPPFLDGIIIIKQPLNTSCIYQARSYGWKTRSHTGKSDLFYTLFISNRFSVEIWNYFPLVNDLLPDRNSITENLAQIRLFSIKLKCKNYWPIE